MGLKRRPRYKSIDEVVLGSLRHEYSATDPEAMDDKIGRSLRYYGYDVERGMQRVPRLRVLKNRLLKELGRPYTSSYYVRPPEKRGSAAMEDFDFMRMYEDLAREFPSVDKGLLGGFVSQAIYLYYLR